MNISRTVMLGVVGGALAAWFAAASTSGTRPAAVSSSPKPTSADKTGAELTAEVGRLHERLHPTAVPQQPARNLFEYGAAHAAPAAPAVAQQVAPVAVAPEEAAPPAALSLSLIGIAEDGGARTAIISGSGEVALVKEGEQVGGFTVVHIDAASAELSEAGGSRTIRLELK